MRHGVQSLRESFLVPRGVRAGTDAGRTWAAEGHGRRLILCTRNRTDPISGFANNGNVPAYVEYYSAHSRSFAAKKKISSTPLMVGTAHPMIG